MDDDYPPKSGMLPQYAHLRGYEECMPEIRKLLGVAPGGNMPDNFIGKAVQTFIDANREETLRESKSNINPTIE